MSSLDKIILGVCSCCRGRVGEMFVKVEDQSRPSILVFNKHPALSWSFLYTLLKSLVTPVIALLNLRLHYDILDMKNDITATPSLVNSGKGGTQ